MADGRLTVEELSERLDLVHAARTDTELEQAVAGLPAVRSQTGLAERGSGYPPTTVALGALLVLLPVPLGKLAAFVSALVLLRSETVPRRREELKLWAAVAFVLQIVEAVLIYLFAF
jgi:hypothetical protein